MELAAKRVIWQVRQLLGKWEEGTVKIHQHLQVQGLDARCDILDRQACHLLAAISNRHRFLAHFRA
jgi:hypothetical protein